MKFNNITFNTLSYLKFHLDDEFDKLPHRNGIYYWVYWPKFDENTITHTELVKHLTEFTDRKLSYSEQVRGTYKFSAEIEEQWFRDTGHLFGLSPSNANKLKDYLIDRASILEFSILFQELCFARPFYIGKANDLKSRLKDHFSYKTKVLKEVEDVKIDSSHVWVGYKLIGDSKGVGLNRIFEEIFSRTFKPGLTIKPN